MRICFLGDAASTHLIKLVRYFKKVGYEICVITLSSERIVPSEEYEGVVVRNISPIRLFGKSKLRLTALFSLRKFKSMVAEFKPEVVHAHSFTVYGSLTPFIGFENIVISAWGSDVLFPNGRSRVMEFFIRNAIKSAKILHSDGIKTYNALIKYGADPRKIRRVEFGVDVDRYNPANFDAGLKKDLNISEGVTVLNLRGLRYPLYGGETLMRAIPIVLESVKDIRFVFVGDGTLKEQFHRTAQQQGFLDKLVFTGYLSEDILTRYLATCDIYVSASLSDSGLAASTAEAMSSGVPVIITDNIDNREWVRDYENGFLFQPNDHETLARRIIELAQNERLRRAMGRRNREIILERDNQALVLPEMARIYEDLARRKVG